MSRAALALLCLLPHVALADGARLPRTPEKCGRMVLHRMYDAPGVLVVSPCISVTVPPRYTVKPNPNPLAVDLFAGPRRLGTLWLKPERPAAPAVSMKVIDKRPRPTPDRWREGGAEFVQVQPQGGGGAER